MSSADADGLSGMVLGVMKTTPYGWDGLFSKKAILPLFVMVFGSIAIINPPDSRRSAGGAI